MQEVMSLTIHLSQNRQRSPTPKTEVSFVYENRHTDQALCILSCKGWGIVWLHLIQNSSLKVENDMYSKHDNVN
jgi:hypothetical protein